MASPHPVAAAESYIGLVELGVGLIPAGTGSTRLAAMASRRAPNGHPSEVQNQLQPMFEAVAMANVATSAVQAQAMGFMAENGIVVMNAERRFHVARAEVVRLSEQGYLAPPVETPHPRARTRHRRRVRHRRDSSSGRRLRLRIRRVPRRAIRPRPDGRRADRAAVRPRGLPASNSKREVFMRLLGETKTQDRITGLLDDRTSRSATDAQRHPERESKDPRTLRRLRCKEIPRQARDDAEKASRLPRTSTLASWRPTRLAPHIFQPTLSHAT